MVWSPLVFLSMAVDNNKTSLSWRLANILPHLAKKRVGVVWGFPFRAMCSSSHAEDTVSLAVTPFGVARTFNIDSLLIFVISAFKENVLCYVAYVDNCVFFK